MIESDDDEPQKIQKEVFDTGKGQLEISHMKDVRMDIEQQEPTAPHQKEPSNTLAQSTPQLENSLLSIAEGDEDVDVEEASEEDQSEYEVEEVLKSRIFRRQLQYQVSWKGYPTDPKFYPAANLGNAQKLIERFHELNPNAERLVSKKSTPAKVPKLQKPTSAPSSVARVPKVQKASVVPSPVARVPKTLSNQVNDNLQCFTLKDHCDLK